MASIVTMLLIAHHRNTKKIPRKNTRLIVVRLLIARPSPSRAPRRPAGHEPAVHLREVTGDALRHLVDEPVEPVDQGAHLSPALRDRVEDAVELLDLTL